MCHERELCLRKTFFAANADIDAYYFGNLIVVESYVRSILAADASIPEKNHCPKR